ncbi:hypothetical protein CLIB1423_02S02168 [[Candida] railenensis]|uniref:ribonuclease III n=1 Tax=[Candida] railenensis TaxID=45579 RepID=A0A9P0VWQ5_9ASCO|nr:hypothetical protein CLIB1423_02S02168 [[Candida] railenensis]
MADSSSLDEFVRHLSQNANTNNFNDMTALKSSSNAHDEVGNTFKRTKLSISPPGTPREASDTSGSGSKARTVPFGHVDMKKLEHCARTLQKQIRIIINEAPDLARLQSLLESPAVDSDVKHEIQRNPLVHMAAALKSKYLSKDLQIFDDILGGNVADDLRDIEYYDGDGEDDVIDQDEYDDDDDDGMDSNNSLPPLPPISNPHLLDRVFIHKSTLNDRTYLSEKELIASHNERLEFLGDSILNNVVTMIIYERFEHSPEGDLSKIRSQLVNNKTLAEFAMAYQLNKRLRSNISDSVLKQGNQKIFADVFEAYIGALAIEHKMELTSIRNWLTKILHWKLNEFDQEISGLEPVNKNAKTDLYSLIGSAAFHPQYKVVKTGDGATKPFIIRCEMGSDVLGEGVAPSAKEAGLRAAMQALKNRPLLEKYGQIRLNTDRNESRINPKLLLNKYQQDSSKESSPDVSYYSVYGSPNPNVGGGSTTIVMTPLDDTYTTSGLQNSTSNNENLSSSYLASNNLFPVIGNESSNFLPEAKNDLYAILNKKGIVPQYRVSSEEDKFKGELHISNVLVAIGVDSSKKKAATRAAMALLKNKDALNEVEKIVS